jgi:hypothetical protein
MARRGELVPGKAQRGEKPQAIGLLAEELIH